MENSLIALFGEAEKGSFGVAYQLDTLQQLAEYFGNPPAESLGLLYAIQVIMYKRNLLFFRVEEEGYSRWDYLRGVNLLETKGEELQLAAICLPGVGDKGIIEAAASICNHHKGILITNESDLYDYLTDIA